MLVLRWFVSASTLALLYFIYRHYHLYLQYVKAKEWIDCSESMWSSGFMKWMLLELFIWAIHSPPGFNYEFTRKQQEADLTYSLDSIFTWVTLLRFYHLLRVFVIYSFWNSENTERILYDCNIFGGRTFALKCELKERPYTILLVTILVCIFMFGYALRVAEIPYMAVSGQDWTYLWNAMWWVIITMTTVGYGDYYPTTYFGRGIGICACFCGTFLVSLMIVSLTISSEFTINESIAFK